MTFAVAHAFELHAVRIEKEHRVIIVVILAGGIDDGGAPLIQIRLQRIDIGAGILPIYTRTPTLLAMTAAGIDALSGGRCVLGLGASGPQVIEGFHGVPYDKPLARTREVRAAMSNAFAFGGTNAVVAFRRA